MDLCLASEQRLGTRVLKWWWEQGCIYLEGMRTTYRLEELEDRDGYEAGEEMED